MIRRCKNGSLIISANYAPIKCKLFNGVINPIFKEEKTAFSFVSLCKYDGVLTNFGEDIVSSVVKNSTGIYTLTFNENIENFALFIATDVQTTNYQYSVTIEHISETEIKIYIVNARGIYSYTDRIFTLKMFRIK